MSGWGRRFLGKERRLSCGFVWSGPLLLILGLLPVVVTSKRRCQRQRTGVSAPQRLWWLTGEVGDALKLSLTAPPVDGKANEACIDFFAKLLEVPRSSVTIAAGLSGRNKVIRVVGLSAEQVRGRLGI